MDPGVIIQDPGQVRHRLFLGRTPTRTPIKCASESDPIQKLVASDQAAPHAARPRAIQLGLHHVRYGDGILDRSGLQSARSQGSTPGLLNTPGRRHRGPITMSENSQESADDRDEDEVQEDLGGKVRAHYVLAKIRCVGSLVFGQVARGGSPPRPQLLTMDSVSALPMQDLRVQPVGATMHVLHNTC